MVGYEKTGSKSPELLQKSSLWFSAGMKYILAVMEGKRKHGTKEQ